jgi:hypothetical protein
LAYPEPIPALKAKDAIKFEEKLGKFSLNTAQKKFYKDARKRFK